MALYLEKTLQNLCQVHEIFPKINGKENGLLYIYWVLYP